MTLDHPELGNDPIFRSQLGIKFNSDNQFGESKEIEQLIKKIDFISGLSEIKEKVGEEEVPFFDQGFLIDKFLGLTNEDRRVNAIYKKKEEEEGKESATTATEGGSTPAAETPAAETPAAEPAAETPAPEPPAAETPAPEA
jgi:uncharacterized protein (UPF0371 family)